MDNVGYFRYPYVTGDGQTYMNLGLKSSVLYVSIGLGSGSVTERVGTGRQFDDDLWHEVTAQREARSVSRALWDVCDMTR